MRFITNALAVIGALVVSSAGFSVVMRQVLGKSTGIVRGPDDKPLARVPVFLDRGSSAIARYVTDSAGEFTLPLEHHELSRATWLICAPNGIPMVGSRDENQIGPTTYGYAKLNDSTWDAYRAFGWRGPIPRECPRGTDAMGWRYPPSAGKGKYAITMTEPEWPKK